jgi:hypothetical protein
MVSHVRTLEHSATTNLNKGDDPIQIGLRALPMGLGIIGGSFIALSILPRINGRIKELLIVATVLMTAFCGAISIATPHNINKIYPLVLFASLGVGAVIIPASIIAQTICPPDLIGTITAITLAIRYVGGAIAFTAYYNAVDHKYLEYSTPIVVVNGIIKNGLVAPTNLELLTDLATLVGQFDFQRLRELIRSSPDVMRKDVAYDVIVAASQEAYALAYRWPYWISIAFGFVTCILAFFLRDIKRFMTMDVAVEQQQQGRLEGDGADKA